MTAFIAILLVGAYIAIGCVVNILLIKFDVLCRNPIDEDLVISLIFLWPVIGLLIVIAWLISRFIEYLESIK